MTTKQIQILEWIWHNVTTKAFSRFEDLHLEEIFGSFASPESLLDAMTETCSLLDRVRSEFPPGFTVCIGISLRSDDAPIGVTFRNGTDLLQELTYNTPSVYVFETGTEPWTIQNEDAVVLRRNTFPWDQNTRCSIHFEYLAPYESEYRRSFWVVV